MMKVRFYIGIGVICLATLVVYYSSFWHLLRGETYTYYLDTVGHNSAWDLITHWYDYEKVRLYLPGDRWLFKPLLFSIDGVEKALFGINYTYWRVTSFCFHLLACLSLYRLLWAIKKGFIAVAVSLFFALLYTSVTTVLYEQIASYALFTALILTALYYVYTRKRAWAAIPCLLTASFINETGIIITGVICLYVWWRHYGKKVAIAYTVLVPIYFTFYLAEKLIDPAPGAMAEFNNLFAWSTIDVGMSAVLFIMRDWGEKIILPSLFTLVPQASLSTYSSVIESVSISWSFIPNLLSLLGIVGVIVYGLQRQFKRCRPFTLLMTAILLVFVATIAIFRVKTHGLHYVIDTGFNTYMFAAWVIVLVYSLFTLMKPKYLIGVAVLFLVLAAMSGYKVYSLNETVKIYETPIRSYLSQIDGFIALHKDATFNASIVGEREDEMSLRLWTALSFNPTIPDVKYYTVPQILYYDHWSDSPDYYLLYSPNEDRLEVAKRGQ